VELEAEVRVCRIRRIGCWAHVASCCVIFTGVFSALVGSVGGKLIIHELSVPVRLGDELASPPNDKTIPGSVAVGSTNEPRVAYETDCEDPDDSLEPDKYCHGGDDVENELLRASEIRSSVLGELL